MGGVTPGTPVPREPLVCRLPADTGAPALARAAVRATLPVWGAPSDLVDIALLVVSELVTNSIVHALDAPVLELTRSATGIRISVHDCGPSCPRSGHVPAEAEAEGGRGLWLVDALTARWGSHASGPGKTIWAELDL